MSVSFSPEFDGSVPHTYECVCGEWKSGVIYPTRIDALNAYADQVSGCTDPYCGTAYAVPVIPEPEVNLSNTNADEVLSYLGLATGDSDFADYCVGTMPAEEFLGRVLMAEALVPEKSGLTTMQIENVVYCGRPDDYLATRFAKLREVAEWAISNNRSVSWG